MLHAYVYIFRFYILLLLHFSDSPLAELERLKKIILVWEFDNSSKHALRTPGSLL